MVILKGVRANVYVAGQIVPEYNPAEDLQADGAENVITKYIESQEGQEFYIEAGPAETSSSTSTIYLHGLAIEFYVDGTLVSAQYGDPGQVLSCMGSEYWQHGVRYLQKFVFSEIKTTEECPKDPKQLKSFADFATKIGAVTVKVRRVTKTSDSGATPNKYPGLDTTKVMPEKALKGSTISHSSSLRAPEVAGKPPKSIKCDYIDSLNKPYAIIHIKYRSRNALQIEGIIPRDPSPPPNATNPAPGPLAEYSSEELRRILHERDWTENTFIKHEDRKRSTTLPRDPGIKREADPDVEVMTENSHRNKKARLEVIDLSND